MDKLTIKVASDRVDALGEVYPGYDFSIESDMTHESVHSWYKIFEKVLASSGFSEIVIMKGAVELAFGQHRTTEMMRQIYDEYCLEEFAPLKEDDGKLPDEE